MSKVCYQCPDRKIVTEEPYYNCHDHCERYAEEVRRHREEKELRDSKDMSGRLIRDYIITKNLDLKRKYGRR